MKSYPPEKVRNVVLVGHAGAGKTTLAESLLSRAGATTRRGRVEDGTTVCDFAPEEQHRELSISLALAPLEWDGHKINLIDTPGYADFVGEVLAALRVADLAVFVVSAAEGLEVQAEVIWRMAAEAGLPRMVFINKLDRELASFDRTLAQLQDRFGSGIAPLELPIGAEAAFEGVADLLSDQAYLYQDGVGTEAAIPDEMEQREHEVHDNLVEGIVVADDDLLERYLEGDTPSRAELEKTLARGVADATVFPVVCGSAHTLVGVDRLATLITEIGPATADRPPVVVAAAGEEVEVAADPVGDSLAFVFKTIADPYVGHISLFKVLSGTVKVDDHLTNSRTGSDARMHGLVTVRGNEQEDVAEIPAGDIGAVAKLTDTATSDTLAPKGKPVVVTPIERPEPVLATAIVARTQPDEDKLGTALHRLQEEDPALRVERSDETHQTLLNGMGETHLAITIEKMKRKFGVEVDTEPVKVPYRETISATAAAEGKHKKQSGGHGQFGVVQVEVSPLERGEGFEFVNKIVGGAIDRKFIPSVEKGVIEAMETGGVHGYPVVDVQTTLLDGKHHDVDSSEMSFKMAGRIGFRTAMANAGPVVLEPISLLLVTVPNESQGDIMGDLNSRRGRVQGSETTGDGLQTISAWVPSSEILRYAIDLRSMTGGRGAFVATHDHYDVLPAQLVAGVSNAKAEVDE